MLGSSSMFQLYISYIYIYIYLRFTVIQKFHIIFGVFPHICIYTSYHVTFLFQGANHGIHQLGNLEAACHLWKEPMVRYCWLVDPWFTFNMDQHCNYHISHIFSTGDLGYLQILQALMVKRRLGHLRYRARCMWCPAVVSASNRHRYADTERCIAACLACRIPTHTNTYPLVMTNIAIEHYHRNSGFSHEKWWFSTAMLNYQRLPTPLNLEDNQPASTDSQKLSACSLTSSGLFFSSPVSRQGRRTHGTGVKTSCAMLNGRNLLGKLPGNPKGIWWYAKIE